MFKDHRTLILLRTILVMGSWLSYVVVLQNSNISVAFPIYKSVSIIIPVILGITLLKERSKLWQKIIGMILGLAGVILLAYN
jgi:drug/metabolite transporter (DMT)-like permease